MGWFDDQIKQRKLLDDEVFADSFAGMAGAILGEKVYAKLSNNTAQIKDSIDEILKYYRVKSREIPENIKDVDEQLEFLLRPYGIMRRTVQLDKGWYKDAVGALLAVRKSDYSIVAMIPTGFSSYSFYDIQLGKRVLVGASNEGEFDTEAIAFYKPFPMRKMDFGDFMAYMVKLISPIDMMFFAASMLIVTLVGLLVPRLQNVLYSNVIDSGDKQLLLITTTFLVCVTVSGLIFSAVKALFQSRVTTKLQISVEAATMMRVLSLPAAFFKKYSAGNLSSRVNYVGMLSNMLITSVVTTGLSSVFSLMYITQVFKFAPSLVWPSLLIILISTAFSVATTLVRMNITRKSMDLSVKESGMSYALISGIQKIKLSGAEKRAFSRWGKLYAKEAQLAYNPKAFLKASSAISIGISLLGTLILYTEAIESGISSADYATFTAAFAMMSTAFAELSLVATSAAQIKPIIEMVQPLFETEPEIAEGKEVISRLNGGIEFNNVSFKYTESTPNIIDDLSLKIKPGDYLAIVGKTGCGKSTLVRLLMGFEKPQSGAIYYDGKDINSIDLKSLRRKIGVVMQEGRLFAGDVYSNIVISAPQLSIDDAWEAAEKAGIADDIRRMPMGMFTIISEGSGGISGGQRQRLMIARAIAPKPRILIFDEATSALDNITQKNVSKALDDLKCTRIVIAHRLSTIRNCNRIICLDGGHIIEDGTYDELIQKGGFFAELVARQRIDAKQEG